MQYKQHEARGACPATYFMHPHPSSRILCHACAKAEGIHYMGCQRFYSGAAALVCSGCGETIAPAIEQAAPPAPQATNAPAPAPEPIGNGSLFGGPLQTQGRLFGPPPSTPASFEAIKLPTAAELARTVASKQGSSRPASSAGTWPPPWHKATPADHRIARKFQDEDTDNLF